MAIFLESMLLASYIELNQDGRPSAMGIFDTLTLDAGSTYLFGMFALAWIGGAQPGAPELNARWEITNPNDPGTNILFGDGPIVMVNPVADDGRCYLVSRGVLLPAVTTWRTGLDRLTVRLTVNGILLAKDLPVVLLSAEGS